VRLSELMGEQATTAGEVEIRGLTADSRKVCPGWLFAALPGTRLDGTAFIDEAVHRGAAAVLMPADSHCALEGAVRLTDANPRRRFALMAARFYARQPRTIAAITGTNGKTSTARFLHRIWQVNGVASGSLGTLGVDSGPLQRPGGLTTPDPADLHALLADLADAEVDHLAMEASSHGLAQYRLDGVRVAAAGFTNLGRDHLDYHGSMEAYFAAKARLFEDLLPSEGQAVVHVDGPAGRRLAARLTAQGRAPLRVGASDIADLRLAEAIAEPTGQRLRLTHRGRDYEVLLPLLGRFQADNAAVAAGLAIGLGLASDAAFSALDQLHGVPGRMERLGRTRSGGSVFVDYAHTPDALKTVLEAARPHCSGRLLLVFGCGGDRDPGKRALMGRVATELADRVIITDDNPRSEDAAAIRSQIAAAAPGARIVADRAEAIATALDSLGEADLLLVADKGHETGQIVGDRVLPFSDIETIRAHLDQEALA